jgi:hypothetical protein
MIDICFLSPLFIFMILLEAVTTAWVCSDDGSRRKLPTLISSSLITGDRARKILEVNYSQDKMIERGKALQLQCFKRKGRSSSTKSSRADRTRKKKEKKNKLRDNEKNSYEDEDEEEDEDDCRNAKEEKEEGSKQKCDSDEGSEVEYNSEDEFEVIRKSVKAENKQSGVEDERSDCYADDTDEIFGKKYLQWNGAQKQALIFFYLIFFLSIQLPFILAHLTISPPYQSRNSLGMVRVDSLILLSLGSS